MQRPGKIRANPGPHYQGDRKSGRGCQAARFGLTQVSQGVRGRRQPKLVTGVELCLKAISVSIIMNPLSILIFFNYRLKGKPHKMAGNLIFKILLVSHQPSQVCVGLST